MRSDKQCTTRSALEIRAAAGRAPHQRGSALLIVIGTLALVAVFAAVYVSIGRTDRRAADAFKQQLEQRDISEQAGDMFTNTIGIDRLENTVYYNTLDPNTPLARREHTDAPYTDWSRRSEVNVGTAAEEALLFTPSGGMYRADGLSALTDFRVASDPWLAATTPTFLGNPGNPLDSFVGDTRTFSRAYAYTPNYPNAWNYLDNRDWLQISNFAPDGRPVNLFNLRPHGAPFNTRNGIERNSIGGFDAEPGFGQSPRPLDGRQIRRMSNYLSLLEMTDPADPQSLLKAFDPAIEDGLWLPGYAEKQNPGLSGNEFYNTPAVWTMYQRFMFMPMNQPFVINNRLGVGNISSWSDPDYPAYQYADADGDGFADSRWFEFVSARDSGSGNAFGSAREDVTSLFDQGDVRYFFAARAIDLSSMVNVNTATDQLAEPTAEYPMGLTPSEVDLRRLLTMQDSAHNYLSDIRGSDSNVRGKPLSLNAAPRPYTDIANLAAPYVWSADRERQIDFLRNPQDYQFYQTSADLTTPDLRELIDDSPSLLIGRYAYSALRRAIVFGGTPGNQLTGQVLDSTRNPGYSANLESDLVQYEVQAGSTDIVDAQERFNQYSTVGLQYAANPALTTSFAGLFGLDDLSELLTYHGINDPDFMSRLERVVDARFDSTLGAGTPDSQYTLRMSPLLSNRDLTLDRLSHSRIIGDDLNFDMRIAPSTEFQSDPSRIGEISRNSMALMALSPRKLMTTISGFTPLSIDDVITDPQMPQALSATSSIPPLLSDLFASGTTAPQDLFSRIYSPALTGEIADMESRSWEDDPTLVDEYNYSTLFYGHRGPELAMRIAAHTAVNMADMADEDTNPTIATLILDDRQGTLDLRDYRDNLDDTVRPENEPEYQLFPGVVEGNLLDVGTAIDSSNLPDKRTAVNVYGIEAMPVITEVSMLYAFTDAPHQSEDENGSQGDLYGDEDYNNSPLPRIETRLGSGERFSHPPRGDVERVTIDTSVNNTNPDYLMQVLAVQIHNPFDVPISLGGTRMDGAQIEVREPLTRKREIDGSGNILQDQIDTNSNYHFDYYLEYAGRFFKLAEYIEWYPAEDGAGAASSYYATDDPASTVAYGDVPNPALDFASDRMLNGAKMPVTNATGAQVYPDFITRNVVIGPGENRVFYAIANQRFDDNRSATTDLPPDLRWKEYLESWDDNDELPNNYRSDIDLDGVIEGYDGREWTGPAEEWVNDQLTIVEGTSQGTIRTRPLLMMSFDPTDGSLRDDEDTFEQLQLPPSTTVPMGLDPSRIDFNEVRLWKKIVTTGEETTDTTVVTMSTPRNLIENDLLVDRMTLETTLESDWNGANVEIEDTWSYPEWFPIPGTRLATVYNARNDNTGLTIADWVTNRRMDSSTQSPPSVGQVTPWMLRTSGNPSTTEFGLRYSNHAGGAEIVDASMPDAFYQNASDIDDPLVQAEIRLDNEIAVSMREFFRHTNQAGIHNIVKTIALTPYAKSDVVNPYRGGASAIDPHDTNNRSAAKFNNTSPTTYVLNMSANGANLEPFGVDSVPEIKVSMSDAQRERPRLTDLLMAWGIGPTFAPDPGRAATAGLGLYEDTEWMTLTEAMAVGLGYEAPMASAPFDEADAVWTDSRDVLNGLSALDEGRLALDRFVPFVNEFIETPPEFNPMSNDRIRGLGIPVAQGVVDRARVFSRLARITDTPSGTPIPELELTNVVPGSININTAPIEVLRLLPGLSPSQASFIDTPTSGPSVREWWGARTGTGSGLIEIEDTNTPDGTLANVTGGLLENLEDNPDIAAAIVAYRDRMFSSPNTSAHVDRGYGVSNIGDVFTKGFFKTPLNGRVQDGSTQSVANNFMTEDPVPYIAGSTLLGLDRQTMTGIEGLRRTPGFSSIGELLSVRIDPDWQTNNIDVWNNLKNLSIDMLGQDGRPQLATSQFGTSIIPQSYGELQNQYDQGTTVDDYSERLAMASNVMNMISVRSDIFAVWFVVHGYREADVANLRPEDPLVPSIAKRYVMVVDRSNVVEPGDKPKILMLKEIPL